MNARVASTNRVIAFTQRVVRVAGRDETRDALDQRWANVAQECDALAVPIPNRVSDPAGFVAAIGADLLVLTGGNDLAGLEGARDAAPERDALERALLDHAREHRLPVLGVCRGLQMMVVAAGGRLTPIDGHVAAPHPIRVLDAAEWPILDGRTVNSFHDWGVDRTEVGAGFAVVAEAHDGSVEAIRHRALPQVGIMWHPERDVARDADLALIAALLDRAPEADAR